MPHNSFHHDSLTLPRISAVLLLAGAVSPSSLRRATQRSSLELPIGPSETLLDRWLEQVGTLNEGAEVPELRLLLDTESPAPPIPAVGSSVCRILRDAGEIRGAGGALRDATVDL